LESESEEEETEETEEEEDTRTPEEKEVERIIQADLDLKEVFEPFQANGREMKVNSVEEVRKLMQMGANYNKKMAGLKPNLKIMKMLENHGLLDTDKLSYLIDLDKKDPAAIHKLIKDSKIDPDTLDMDEDSGYKEKTYTVNDEEVELDETLSEIKDTDSYAKTLDIISNKWDDSSKHTLLKNPAGIKIINDHVASGIYDKIITAVETERMFGRIPDGLSDLEAYKYVGDQINAKGGFAPQQSTSRKKTVVGTKATKSVDPKLNSKKKAATSTKGKSAVKQKADFNPLSMSDEEFAKVGIETFI
jgi:hypothetical protein